MAEIWSHTFYCPECNLAIETENETGLVPNITCPECTFDPQYKGTKVTNPVDTKYSIADIEKRRGKGVLYTASLSMPLSKEAKPRSNKGPA